MNFCKLQASPTTDSCHPATLFSPAATHAPSPLALCAQPAAEEVNCGLGTSGKMEARRGLHEMSAAGEYSDDT